MRRNRSVWMIASSAVLLVVLGGVAWEVLEEPWKPRLRAGPALVARVDGITVGRRHTPPPVSPVAWLRNWSSVGRVRPRIPVSTPRDTLIAWLQPSGPRSANWPPDRVGLELRDEHGCVFEARYYSGSGQVRFPAYPRSARWFRLVAREYATGRIVGEVQVPISTPLAFPPATPGSYPLQTTTGPLTITAPRAPVSHSAAPRSQWTLPLLLTEGGRPAGQYWSLVGLTVSDGVGNQLEQGGWGIQGPLTRVRLPSLCREAPVWNARFRICRRENHPAGPDLQWTTPPLALPPARGTTSYPEVVWSQRGVRVNSLQCGAASVGVSPPLIRAPSSQTVWVGVGFRSGARSAEIYLVRAVDERGRDLLPTDPSDRAAARLGQHGVPGRRREFPLLPHPDSRTVRLTFGIQLVREVKLALPPRAPNADGGEGRR